MSIKSRKTIRERRHENVEKCNKIGYRPDTIQKLRRGAWNPTSCAYNFYINKSNMRILTKKEENVEQVIPVWIGALYIIQQRIKRYLRIITVT